MTTQQHPTDRVFTADSLTRLRAISADLRAAWYEAERREEEARKTRESADAVGRAHNYMIRAFGSTLSRLLPTPEHWAGYPSLLGETGAVTGPCAVAHLGGGVFLRYESTPVPGAHDVRDDRLYAIHPCPCGDWIQTRIPDEYQLADTIADRLAPAECRRICRAATWTQQDAR